MSALVKEANALRMALKVVRIHKTSFIGAQAQAIGRL